MNYFEDLLNRHNIYLSRGTRNESIDVCRAIGIYGLILKSGFSTKFDAIKWAVNYVLDNYAKH